VRYRQSFRYYESGSPFEYDLVRYLYTKKGQVEIGDVQPTARPADEEGSDRKPMRVALGAQPAAWLVLSHRLILGDPSIDSGLLESGQ
jgi:hypothetical protein